MPSKVSPSPPVAFTAEPTGVLSNGSGSANAGAGAGPRMSTRHKNGSQASLQLKAHHRPPPLPPALAPASPSRGPPSPSGAVAAEPASPPAASTSPANAHAYNAYTGPPSGGDAFDAIVQAANPAHPDHAAWMERFGSWKPSSHGHGTVGGAHGAPGSDSGSGVERRSPLATEFGALGPDHALGSGSGFSHHPTSTRKRRSSSNARRAGLPMGLLAPTLASPAGTSSVSRASSNSSSHQPPHAHAPATSSSLAAGSVMAPSAFAKMPHRASSAANHGPAPLAASGAAADDSSDDMTFGAVGGSSIGHGANAGEGLRNGSSVSLLLRSPAGGGEHAAGSPNAGSGVFLSNHAASTSTTPRRRRRREASAASSAPGGGAASTSSHRDPKGKSKALPPPVPPPRIASHPANQLYGAPQDELPMPSGSGPSLYAAGPSSAAGHAGPSSSVGHEPRGFPPLVTMANGFVTTAPIPASDVVGGGRQSSIPASRSQSIDLPRVAPRTSSMLDDADRKAILQEVGYPSADPPVNASPTKAAQPNGFSRLRSWSLRSNGSRNAAETEHPSADPQLPTSASSGSIVVHADRPASALAGPAPYGIYSVPSSLSRRPADGRHLSTVYQEDTEAGDEFFDANEEGLSLSKSRDAIANGSAVSPPQSPPHAGPPRLRTASNRSDQMDQSPPTKRDPQRFKYELTGPNQSASFHSLASFKASGSASALKEMSDHEKRTFLAHNTYYIPPASRMPQPPLSPTPSAGSPSPSLVAPPSPAGPPLTAPAKVSNRVSLRGRSSTPTLAPSKKKPARAPPSSASDGHGGAGRVANGTPPPVPPLPYSPPPVPPSDDALGGSARRPSIWKSTRFPSFGLRKRVSEAHLQGQPAASSGPSERYSASDAGHGRAASVGGHSMASGHAPSEDTNTWRSRVFSRRSTSRPNESMPLPPAPPVPEVPQWRQKILSEALSKSLEPPERPGTALETTPADATIRKTLSPRLLSEEHPSALRQSQESSSLLSVSPRASFSPPEVPAPADVAKPLPMGPPPAPMRPPRAANRPSFAIERPTTIGMTANGMASSPALASLPRESPRSGLFDGLRNRLKNNRASSAAVPPVPALASGMPAPVASSSISSFSSFAASPQSQGLGISEQPQTPTRKREPRPAMLPGMHAESGSSPAKTPDKGVQEFDAMLKGFGQLDAQRRRAISGRAREMLQGAV